MRKLFLASTMLVAACSTAPTPAIVAHLPVFVRADLQAALEDATAHNDVISAPCYQALLDAAETLPGKSGTPVGAFSAFQQARDARLTVEGGVPMAVKIACGALVVDEQMLILRLAAIGAGRALLPVP